MIITCFCRAVQLFFLFFSFLLLFHKVSVKISTSTFCRIWRFFFNLLPASPEYFFCGDRKFTYFIDRMADCTCNRRGRRIDHNLAYRFRSKRPVGFPGGSCFFTHPILPTSRRLGILQLHKGIAVIFSFAL